MKDFILYSVYENKKYNDKSKLFLNIPDTCLDHVWEDKNFKWKEYIYSRYFPAKLTCKIPKLKIYAYEKEYEYFFYTIKENILEIGASCSSNWVSDYKELTIWQ